MHICYIGDASSIHVIKWAEFFINSGHRVSIISNVENNIKGAEVFNIGERHCGVHIKCLSAIYEIWRKRRLIRKLLTDNLKPNLIHAHYATDYGFLAAISGYHPFVLTTHGSDLLVDFRKDKLSEKLVTYALKRADIITAPSTFMSNMIKQIAKKRVVAIQYGIDTARFNIFSASRNFDREKTLISTRALTEKYDIQTLINALPLINRKIPELKAIIAGSGDKKALFEDSLKNSELDRNVQFTGNVSNDEMPTLLNEASIYVSTSPSDGISISLLEAMACGLFPVVTDIPGNRELVDHKRNGLLFKTGDAEGLANAVFSAYNDRQRRQTAIGMNRQIIEDRFSISRNFSLIEDLYLALHK